MNQEEIKKIVLAAVRETDGKKKLACAMAFQLAKAHALSLKDIGDCCNANDIKIGHCQLGCFK
ncbi:MAG: hypothetical protein GF350_07095 [Chitinivibrionales bacterium]|nr:hypothetical protein [Chitinivibrionales bacterium]